MKGFPTKQAKLEIPYRSIMYHSSCDILPPLPCHILMTVVVHYYYDETVIITNNHKTTNTN